jgi:hypothetical protein
MTKHSPSQEKHRAAPKPAENYDFPESSDLCDFGYVLARTAKDEARPKQADA